MTKVKITVLRKEFYPEYADRYLTDGKSVGPCPILNVGDTFIYSGGAEMPEGFCPWAWIDLYRSISATANGATTKPWTNKDGIDIGCCTDGIRPVIFSVEAIGGEIAQ